MVLGKVVHAVEGKDARRHGHEVQGRIQVVVEAKLLVVLSESETRCVTALEEQYDKWLV